MARHPVPFRSAMQLPVRYVDKSWREIIQRGRFPVLLAFVLVATGGCSNEAEKSKREVERLDSKLKVKESELDSAQKKISELEKEHTQSQALLAESEAEKNKLASQLTELRAMQSNVLEQVKLLSAAKAQVDQAADQVLGTAYVSRRNGDSIILRGLQVVLCDKEIKPAWEEALKGLKDQEGGPFDDTLQRLRREGGQPTPLKEAMRVKMASTLATLFEQLSLKKYTKSTTETNVDGKFRFKGQAEGEYFVYVRFQTANSVACWMLPITIQSNKPVELEVNNSNAAVIVNSAE